MNRINPNFPANIEPRTGQVAKSSLTSVIVLGVKISNRFGSVYPGSFGFG